MEDSMHKPIVLGRTGSSEYVLKGMWVYRKAGGIVQRYDSLPEFTAEILAGALGPGWRETAEGKREIDRFIQ
jgi:hypothetical protein